MKRFQDSVVVITGGSDGIGFETAKAFASEGAYVYVTGRRQDRLAAAAREMGERAVAVPGDVANSEDLDQLYARIARERGRVDVVFANAGISETVPLEAIDDAHFDRVLGTNLKGMIFTVQKALPLMKEGGAIVLAGSGSGSKGFGGLTVYNATKAAIRSLARTWTTELKARGIRVNVVSPGVVQTPAMDRFLAQAPDMKDVLEGMIPLGRIGDAAEIADAVLFLAAQESRYVAGVELFVDGGIMAV